MSAVSVNSPCEPRVLCALTRPRAIPQDNAFWQTGPAGPTGFESAAVARFTEYVRRRFGQRTAPFFGGLRIAPPTASQRNSSADHERALFNIWKVWRERAGLGSRLQAL